MSLPPKPIITPIAPPKACAKLTPAQILSGPPMLPEKRIQAYSSEEFEEFIEEWAFHYLLEKLGKYQQIARMGGAGDKGRDVVAYIDPISSGGRLDIYQCKHYDSPLAFTEISIELAKLCYFTHLKVFRVPEEYRFVSPRNVGPSLGFLFEKPDDLKEKLIEVWVKKPFEKIIAGAQIKLQGDLKTYVENFDFSIFGCKSIQEVISEFKQTNRYPQRFGGGLTRACPANQSPPDDIEDHEQRYVEQLVGAYRDDCKDKNLSHEELSKPYHSHFQRARENYFCAETLKAYEKDNKIDGYSFEELQQDILAGVIDVAEEEHDSGFHRVKRTTKAAVDMTLAEHPLNQFVQTKTKHGICHQLANEDELTWVPK